MAPWFSLARTATPWFAARLRLSMSSKTNQLRPHSSIVTDGPDRAPARSMLRPVGFTDADFQKSVVGIASTWSMVTP